MGERSKMTWEADKRWSDKFLSEIKSILGLHLIGEPPKEEDAEHNTDLIVLTMAPVRIGCRVRKHEYVARYGDEFTIRAGRPSGAKTELAKIVEGWGDYFFYGFADAKEKALCRWLLGDMNVFRGWFARQLVENKGRAPGQHKDNHDNSSHFRAFRVADMPVGFVVARSDAA